RWFMRGIDELLDETHCRFAFAQPLRLGKSYAEGFMHVKRQTFDCDLPAFIESHRKEFTAIHVHFASEKRRSTAKLRRVLATVLDNPQRSRGRNALVMGDCVIAVEMPENACLFTTNLRDFQPICTAIGKKVVGAL
ncbi:hypothetical protein HYR99_40050, partial [Candidatus Poribacteria bacterium]|nr:hypothetical protein [Candidatus Poribacteria bacterium]